MVINNKVCDCYHFTVQNVHFTGQEWEAGVIKHLHRFILMGDP